LEFPPTATAVPSLSTAIVVPLGAVAADPAATETTFLMGVGALGHATTGVWTYWV
jgi:hypothetical protein